MKMKRIIIIAVILSVGLFAENTIGSFKKKEGITAGNIGKTFVTVQPFTKEMITIAEKNGVEIFMNIIERATCMNPETRKIIASGHRMLFIYKGEAGNEAAVITIDNCYNIKRAKR